VAIIAAMANAMLIFNIRFMVYPLLFLLIDFIKNKLCSYLWSILAILNNATKGAF